MYRPSQQQNQIFFDGTSLDESGSLLLPTIDEEAASRPSSSFQYAQIIQRRPLVICIMASLAVLCSVQLLAGGTTLAAVRRLGSPSISFKSPLASQDDDCESWEEDEEGEVTDSGNFMLDAFLQVQQDAASLLVDESTAELMEGKDSEGAIVDVVFSDSNNMIKADVDTTLESVDSETAKEEPALEVPKQELINVEAEEGPAKVDDSSSE